MFRRGSDGREDTRPGPAEAEELFSGEVERLRPLLMVRLNRADAVPTEYQPVVRGVGGGIVATLVVRAQGATHHVLARDLQRWDADPAELWAVAMHNLLREPYEVQELAAPGSGVYGVMGSYGASHLLRLDRLLDGTARHGAVVGVPSSGLLVYHQIRDANALMRLAQLPAVVAKLYERLDRLSTGVFWWHGGLLERVEVSVDSSGTNKLTGSAAFTEMLMTLVGEFEPPGGDAG